MNFEYIFPAVLFIFTLVLCFLGNKYPNKSLVYFSLESVFTTLMIISAILKGATYEEIIIPLLILLLLHLSLYKKLKEGN